jgi:hypothetical protein
MVTPLMMKSTGNLWKVMSDELHEASIRLKYNPDVVFRRSAPDVGQWLFDNGDES